MKQNRRISGSAFNQNTKSNEGKIIYLVGFFSLRFPLSRLSPSLSFSQALSHKGRGGRERGGGE